MVVLIAEIVSMAKRRWTEYEQVVRMQESLQETGQQLRGMVCNTCLARYIHKYERCRKIRVLWQDDRVG